MADRGRGGYRRPSRPAAVSPPQSGLRTDAGPSDKQPIRTPTGGAYGQAGALDAQQAGADMQSGGPATPAAGGAGQPPADQGAPPVDMFAPTQRPSDPIPSTMPPVTEVPSADQTMRQLVQSYPSPWMMRLLRLRGG